MGDPYSIFPIMTRMARSATIRAATVFRLNAA